MNQTPVVERILIVFGLSPALIGPAILLLDKIPYKTFLEKIPLGRLPGDISINRPDFKFYFPPATGLMISLVLTLLFWLFKR